MNTFRSNVIRVFVVEPNLLYLCKHEVKRENVFLLVTYTAIVD